MNLLNSQVEICETQEVQVHATSIYNITTVVISAFTKDEKTSDMSLIDWKMRNAK